MTTHDWMMRLYDLCMEIDDFANDPSEEAFRDLCDRAMKYRTEIDLELDLGPEPDTDDSDDGGALASAGFGTDEDYGGTDDRT